MEFVPTPEEIERAKQDIKDTFLYVPDGAGGVKPMTFAVRANTDVGYRENNVAINIKRKLPRFLQRTDLMQLRGEPIAIVGGGPSVKDYLPKIQEFKWIMAAGSCHDYLIENGIIPTFAVSTDSKEETNDYYRRLNLDTQYLIASTSPPSLFDRLWLHEGLEQQGCKTWLWHFFEQVDPEHYQGEQACGWGCMVGVVCIQIALWLGFQEHHYFGYDCSIERDHTHAYEVADWEKKHIRDGVTEAEVGDEKTRHLTTTAFIAQCTHFLGIYRSPDGNYLNGTVYGKGLLWDVIRQTPGIEPWLKAA
jgi:hypothetical protein